MYKSWIGFKFIEELQSLVVKIFIVTQRMIAEHTLDEPTVCIHRQIIVFKSPHEPGRAGLLKFVGGVIYCFSQQ